MVLSQPQSPHRFPARARAAGAPHGLREAAARVQPTRVIGLAGAIALNATAFLLLLAPVSAPPVAVPVDDVPTIVELREGKPPPTPPPPRVVPVVQPRATTTPTPRRVVETPPVQQDVIVDQGTEYVEPARDPVPDAVAVVPTPDPGPLESTQLQYAAAPAPAYPREALLDGIAGTVVLRVLVDVDGKPLTVEVQRSSGNRRLDDAARRQVLRKWLFRPALRDGRAVQVYGIVPVEFTLERG